MATCGLQGSGRQTKLSRHELCSQTMIAFSFVFIHFSFPSRFVSTLPWRKEEEGNVHKCAPAQKRLDQAAADFSKLSILKTLRLVASVQCDL